MDLTQRNHMGYWIRALPVIPAVCLITASWIAAEEGPVTKSVRFESDPTGVEVFLKQGTKEISIGKTPFTYQAEFHSTISVLRLIAKKKGYETVKSEVSATQDILRLVLKPALLVEDPNVHQEPSLKALQQRINPILVKELPKMLEAEEDFSFDLAGPVRVADLDGDRALLLNLAMTNATGLPKGSGKKRQQALLKTLWPALGKTVVLPLAATLKNEKELHSFLLQVFFNEQQLIFEVGVKTETKVRMECRPTLELVTEYGIGGGTRMGTVMNPCGRLEPVYTTEFKADPHAKSTSGQGRAQYMVPLLLLSKSPDLSQLYDKIGVSLVDAQGDTVEQHGTMAEVLLAAKDPRAMQSDNGLSERLNAALKSAGFEFKTPKEQESPDDRDQRLRAIAASLKQAKDYTTLVLLLEEVAPQQAATSKATGTLHRWAGVWLARLYLDGTEVPINPEKAAQTLRLLAEAGDHESQLVLARLYVKGLGVDKNSEEAIFWLKKSAKQGNKEAVEWLAEHENRVKEGK